MKSITIKLPISIQPTANNDGHIITDVEGTEYFFYNQEGTTELEYDGFCAKDAGSASFKGLLDKVEKNIEILEQYPDDMKLEDLDFKMQYVWDTNLQRLGLNSRSFSFGSEFGDIIHRLQKPNDKIRWCVFSVDRNYYISKEHKLNTDWYETWTKQMDKDLEEAKKYCEEDAFRSFIGIEIHFCGTCKSRLDFKEAACLFCESKSINSI